MTREAGELHVSKEFTTTSAIIGEDVKSLRTPCQSSTGPWNATT